MLESQNLELILFELFLRPTVVVQPMHIIEPPYAVKNEVKKSIFTLFSPYILLFKANNGGNPSLQVESHCSETMAIVVKTKEERWGSLGRKSPESARGPSTCLPHIQEGHYRWHKGRQQKNKKVQQEEDKRSELQGLICYSPLPSVYTWAAKDNRCNLRKRKVSYYSKWAVLASISLLSRSEMVGVTYLYGSNLSH